MIDRCTGMVESILRPRSAPKDWAEGHFKDFHGRAHEELRIPAPVESGRKTRAARKRIRNRLESRRCRAEGVLRAPSANSSHAASSRESAEWSRRGAQLGSCQGFNLAEAAFASPMRRVLGAVAAQPAIAPNGPMEQAEGLSVEASSTSLHREPALTKRTVHPRYAEQSLWPATTAHPRGARRGLPARARILRSATASTASRCGVPAKKRGIAMEVSM